MFTFKRFVNHIFFEGDAGGGGGAGPAPAAPAPAAPAAPAPGAPAAPVAPGTPAGAPAVDYAAKVAEWGGDEAIADAVALRQALATPEGVKALFFEAGKAQGLGNDKLEALFAKEVAAGGDPIEALLADPERQLSAAEVVKLLDARETKLKGELAAQGSAASHAQAISTAIDSTFSALKVSDADRDVVLALADRELSVPVEQASPEQVRAALAKGHAAFEKLVDDRAEARVKAKHEQRQALPKALSGGTAPGGEALPEPVNLEEAKSRVRAAFAADNA